MISALKGQRSRPAKLTGYKNLVDRKGLEPLFSTCKADVIPPILTAQVVEAGVGV